MNLKTMHLDSHGEIVNGTILSGEVLDEVPVVTVGGVKGLAEAADDNFVEGLESRDAQVDLGLGVVREGVVLLQKFLHLVNPLQVLPTLIPLE